VAKPKKWTHLRDKFPREVETYSDAVAAYRKEAEGTPLDGLLKAWNEEEAEKAHLEDRLSRVNASIAALSSLAFEKMDAADIETLTVGDGKFSRKTDVSAKPVDKAALLAWFQTHMPEMVTVHSATITSQTKLAIESGGDVPDGVEITLRDRIHRTNA
jgi:hypothetical protein